MRPYRWIERRVIVELRLCARRQVRSKRMKLRGTIRIGSKEYMGEGFGEWDNVVNLFGPGSTSEPSLQGHLSQLFRHMASRCQISVHNRNKRWLFSSYVLRHISVSRTLP